MTARRSPEHHGMTASRSPEHRGVTARRSPLAFGRTTVLVGAAVALVGAVVLAGVTACGAPRRAPAAPAADSRDATSAPDKPTADEPAADGGTADGTTANGAGAGGAKAGAGGAPPTRVRIPVIGVDAPLEPLRLDASGALGTPKDYGDAGWYADGTVPGEIGPAVIAGHVDAKTGPAVFFRLGQLRTGDLVEVARAGSWLRFHVVAVGRYPKDRFPTDRVYGPTPDPQLRLITCSGRFDQARGSYLDNTVVYAVSG